MLLGKSELLIEKKYEFNFCDGDALFKVLYTTICGSDVRIMAFGDSRVNYPRTLGHEIVARVIEPGARKDLRKGDLVSIGADVPCGTCSFCQNESSNLCTRHLAVGYQFDGGLAEYLVFPLEYLNLAPIVSVKPKESIAAYALAEPLGCVLHGLQYSNVKKGNRILILGGGPIGLMIAHSAQVVHEVKAADILIVEPLQSRRDFLLKCGVESVSNLKKQEINMDLKFDRIFTATSNAKSHIDLLDYCRPGAVVNFFGGVPRDTSRITLDPNLLHYSEISVGGSHGSTPEHHDQATKIIASNEIFWDSLITSRISIESLANVVETVSSGREMKIAVQMENVV